MARSAFLAVQAALFFAAGATFGAGLTSSGNVDGVLTWKLGDLAPGASAREVVLFVYDASPEKAAKLLEQARKDFAALAEPADPKDAKAEPTVWVRNDTTDFALQGPGHFFWEGGRQSLTSRAGGQLSRFGWYVHYNDGEERRAGTPIEGSADKPDAVEVVRPIVALGSGEAAGTMRSADKALQVRIRAVMGKGATVGVEFVLTNVGPKPLANVRLTAYSNLEANHDHENDYGALDAATGALLAVDGPTGACAAMAGLKPPASGFSGTWPSGDPLRAAAGEPLDKWQAFAGVPKDVKQSLASAPAAGGVYAEYAPAPQLEPKEPETRSLSEAEAAAALERDWIFQAEEKPLAARAAEEIRWARDLAARIAKDPKAPDLKAELADLAAAETRLAGKPDDAAAKAAYLGVRAAKRRIMLKNPVVDFSQVLFVDEPYPQGREWQHQARHRNGMMAVPGGRLLVLDGLSPAGKLRKLAPEKPGYFWRPDLSFDGKKVLFCYRPHDGKSFHLYEIGADGTGLRQLTSGPYDDLDPIYLPDGHLLFSTSRSNTYVRCMPYTYSYVLARCDADGGHVYLVSQNNEPDWCPSLLNDGRVIYSRWEYTDKALWRIESLWTTNQDGTDTATFWGNQSVWPDHLAEPRAIPGSNRVMFTGLAHHNWFAGSIGILDPEQGHNFPKGLAKVTSETPWPECGTPPEDPHESATYHTSGRFGAYKTPWPLSEKDFLVSAERGGKFALYLMDTDGNRELVYEGAFNIWHAMPLKPRPRPPAQPDRVAWPGTGKDRKPLEPGVLFSANVYQGMPDAVRGKAKMLRVIQMDARTYSLWTRDARYSGPAVSVLQDDGVKRILGTVPIESDGSVSFRVPPGQALHFQICDEFGRALQTMRSFTGVMPGEQRGCIGCHEMHSATPAVADAAATHRAPSDLTPPPWGTATVGYERFVQPVLDRYCGKCHEGEGKARRKLDMTLRPAGVFKEPYVTLVNSGLAGALMAENYGQSDPASYVTSPPMTHLSYTSTLIDHAMSGRHKGVKVEGVDLQKLIAWVDANCPFRGDEEIRALPDPDFAGIENLPVRPQVKSAPIIARP